MEEMKNLYELITEARIKKEPKTPEAKGLSILDQYLNGDVSAQDLKFIKPNGPTIYAFVTNKVKDAIKIGYTDQHPEKRIEQWREIYGKKEGEVTLLGYWSAEEFDKAGERVFFWDHSVHGKVTKRGYLNVKKEEFNDFLSEEGKTILNLHISKEFFRKYKTLIDGKMDYNEADALSDKLIEDIIKEMRENINNGTADFKTYKFTAEGKTSRDRSDKIWGAPASYSNTELQEDAIKNGVAAIKAGKEKLLMAAVMRFGKTHASYEIVKNAGMRKVLVTSGKADVRKAWRDDINHVHFYNDFVFIEIIDKYKWDISYKKDKTIVTESRNIYEDTDIIGDFIKEGKTIIVFSTLQDLAGSLGTLKAKHRKVFDEQFDMLIIDETHYGSHSAEWGKVAGFGEEDIDPEAVKELEQIKKDQKTIEGLKVKYKVLLQVSGTPYYILASNEMLDPKAEIISKVSYTDMVRARDKWEGENKGKDRSESPYFGIPTLHKVGLELTKECKKAIAETGATTSISKLFEVKGGKFIHEKAITKLMKSIFGDGKSKTLAFLNNQKVKGDKVCKHTLIRLPKIEHCEMLKKVFEGLIDTNERKVINIVGSHPDVRSIDDLNRMLEALDNKGKKSIILTVNRMMTGVSIPLLDSMIYLRDSSSPQDYDQAIFRLCTRNVKDIEGADEGMPKKVNMKENVYLIDFNISNMFNMVANSARMKAAAEGNASSDRIAELIKDDLEATSLFAERGGEIANTMHQMTVKDMLEIYTKYNANKSIADIANDDINLFIGLFEDKNFQAMVSRFDVENDKSKNVIGIDDTTTDTLDLTGLPKIAQQQLAPLAQRVKDAYKGKDSKAIRMTQEKFKAIVKMMMYCNLCLDNPFKDMDSLLKGAKEDVEFKSMLNDFNISVRDLSMMYDYMSVSYKMLFNQMLLRIALLSSDMKKNAPEKFATAVAGLGRLSQNEVVTPSSIVKKMIGKLNKSVYKSAKSILLVNEKHGEFFEELCNQFGKEEMAKKCKIAPSSMVGYHLIRTKIKHLGLDKYINDIILSIEDIDGNSKYDIKDFLSMSNSDIMKKNGGKKFDVVLMNPPYGSVGGDTLHLKFVDKCLDIANHQITVMPFTFVTKVDHKPSKKYKEKFSPYLSEVEEVDSKEFSGTNMPNVGIYTFGNETQTIDIKYVNSPKETLSSLSNKSIFNNIENEILNVLNANNTQNILNDLGRLNSWKNIVNNAADHQLALSELVEKSIKKTKKWFEIKNVILLVNRSNGGMNGTAISSKNGQIFDNYIDLKNFFIKNPLGIGYNGLVFKSKKAAQNCKFALQNPLLRFTLYKLQDDQNMVTRVYKYIPAINWEDPRVKTDEGLLEVCGCPKDKCKEYADYCKKVIEEVDKKKK